MREPHYIDGQACPINSGSGVYDVSLSLGRSAIDMTMSAIIYSTNNLFMKACNQRMIFTSLILNSTKKSKSQLVVSGVF